VKKQFSIESKDLVNATKIILPGVGHFDHGMKQLHNSGMIELLNQKVVNDNVPILGICLGAQMMCKGSEEGNLTGSLGLMPKLRNLILIK
jgi:glutamine amidotransferase